MIQDCSAADCIRQFLVDQTDLVTMPSSNQSWPCYVSKMPTDPDRAVCIYDTTGRQDGRNLRTGEQYEHPGIQVRVRATNSREAYKKIKNITTELEKLKSVLVSPDNGEAIWIRAFTRTTTIISMGEELEERREAFVVNGIVTLEPEGV